METQKHWILVLLFNHNPLVSETIYSPTNYVYLLTNSFHFRTEDAEYALHLILIF